jgi:hypothetical protein
MRGTRRELFAETAKRHSYDEWCGTNRLGEELLVWSFFLRGEELPGWTPRRIDEVLQPGWPRMIQSMWTPPEGGLALLDVFECSSRRKAHEFVITLVAQFESPLVTREEHPEIGDVVFAGPGDGLRVVARANLVMFLRSGDKPPVPIQDAAAQLDAELVSKPEAPAEPEAPTIVELRLATPEPARGSEAPLMVAAEDPRREPLFYKCFSPSGELELRDDEIVYRHTSREPPRLEVYAVAPGRAVARRELRSGS